MGDTLAQDRFAMPEPFLSANQFCAELIEGSLTKVFEFAPLEQIPHAFLGIQFRSVARQAFQMDALGSPLGQELFDGPRAMNACPIPDDQQGARDLAQKQLQETHHIRAFERVVLNRHDQAPIHGEAAHRGKMIAGQGDRQHRCLSHRSVGPHSHRQHIQSRLIYKDDRALFLFGLFFTSSEWWSRHTWMACSSRWLARVSGFCRLCLMAERRREQWVG
jgi:hypothetical protein